MIVAGSAKKPPKRPARYKRFLVFKREDCSDGLRLLAESHANRIATAQFSPTDFDSDFE